MGNNLLQKNNNSSDDSNDSGGDARYLARITAQQQEILDELQALKESHANKNKKSTVKEEVEVEGQESGNDVSPQKRKAVEVSKNKSIMQIITDKFAISVEKLKWKKIINQLRNLFGFANEEARLLKELGENNQAVSSLLAGKNKEKLLSQLRIAEMLRELGSKSQLSLQDINKILVIQKLLISELRNVNQQQNISNVAGATTARQQQRQMIISEQKLSNLGSQILGGNIQSVIGANFKSGEQTQEVKSNTAINLISETNQSNKMYYGYYLMYQPHVNVQLNNHNIINILAPLEKAAMFLINKAEKAFMSAVNTIESDLIKMFNGNGDSYKCNPAHSHNEKQNHNHQHKKPDTKMNKATADPCKEGTCGHTHH